MSAKLVQRVSQRRGYNGQTSRSMSKTRRKRKY
jgi:hypothetical protein